VLHRIESDQPVRGEQSTNTLYGVRPRIAWNKTTDLGGLGGEAMKALQFSAIALILIAGCQTTQLNRSTGIQARSVNDIYYDQILSNIAMLHDCPTTLPYFSLPQAGQNTVQCSLTLTYNPTWDLITSATSFAGKYLLDKQSATLSGADTDIEVWTTAPTIVPDRLLLMKYAYEVAAGNSEHYGYLINVLDYYYRLAKRPKDVIAKERARIEEQHKSGGLTDEEYWDQIARVEFEERIRATALGQFTFPYSTLLHSGWYKTGRRHDVPKNACYVAHYGKTYAWVIPGCEAEIANFTIVVLNLATYVAPDRKPQELVPTVTKAAK
jgi:hypothetical protein